MSPQRPDLVLSTDVPDVELCILVGDCFYVEANGRDSGDILFEFEVVENSCSGSIVRVVSTNKHNDYW
jgi:hypothetical protein